MSSSSEASLPVLLHKRSSGKSPSVAFRDEIAIRKSELELLDNPRMASPHTGAIPALQVDRREGRFLLSGSGDATVSVFDLSKWGTDHYLQGKAPSDEDNLYKPVARSTRVPFGNELETPHGHSHSVVEVQWHPDDSGAFLSASADGQILVWDTHEMEPVVCWKPLPSIACMNLSTSHGRSNCLLAIGSKDEELVRLMDIRSGAASHSLVGHKEGITCVQWSPVSDVVLASGSHDGTIRLWDIRKPGSRSCVAVLDRDTPVETSTSTTRPFRPSYSHLSNPFEDDVSPNNYASSKSKAIVSHDGSVSALAFASDGASLVSTGTDGKLQVWDLLSNGYVLPLSFVYRANQSPVSRHRIRIPLVLRECGNETTAWVGGHGSQILGYSLQRGGRPTQVLDGHMDVVTSLEIVDHSMQMISGASDGMILAWGSPTETSKRRKRGHEDEDQRKRVRDGTMRDADYW